MVRCKGRIEHANLESDSKHPILLPSKHPFVDLIIRDTHTGVKHSGIRDTLTTIRERFWVLRGRQAVKRILKQCVVCRRAEGVPFATPPSPDLPRERVSDAPPFVNTGLDFVGPLFIRKHGTDSLSNDKVYILLFTCASTRGVHLELTPSLDVPSFLRADSKEVEHLKSLPILLYINDMPDSLSHSSPSLYADDTEIYASSNDCADLVNKVNIDLENIRK